MSLFLMAATLKLTAILNLAAILSHIYVHLIPQSRYRMENTEIFPYIYGKFKVKYWEIWFSGIKIQNGRYYTKIAFKKMKTIFFHYFIIYWVEKTWFARFYQKFSLNDIRACTKIWNRCKQLFQAFTTMYDISPNM